MNITEQELIDLELTRDEYNDTVKQYQGSITEWCEKRKLFLKKTPEEKKQYIDNIKKSVYGYDIEQEVNTLLSKIKDIVKDSPDLLNSAIDGLEKQSQLLKQELDK